MRLEEWMCSEILEQAWGQVNTNYRAIGHKLTGSHTDRVTAKDKEVRRAPLLPRQESHDTPINSHSV